MLDRERIFAKIDELESYVRDLRTIAPDSFTVYQQIEKKRACERLLQIAVECVIDICGLIVSGLRLGFRRKRTISSRSWHGRISFRPRCNRR